MPAPAVEDLGALRSNCRREIDEIHRHWEEGLALGSGELCATAASSLLFHAAFALPELLGLLEADDLAARRLRL